MTTTDRPYSLDIFFQVEDSEIPWVAFAGDADEDDGYVYSDAFKRVDASFETRLVQTTVAEGIELRTDPDEVLMRKEGILTLAFVTLADGAQWLADEFDWLAVDGNNGIPTSVVANLASISTVDEPAEIGYVHIKLNWDKVEALFAATSMDCEVAG